VGAGRPLSVERILEAFLAPALRRSNDPEHRDFIRLMGRMYSEPSESLKTLVGRQFREILERFGAALARALPHLPPADLHWRFHFGIGAMVHVIADPARMEKLSGGLCDPRDGDGTLARLLAFFAAGLRAPPTAPGRGAP
jgi:hypothetical protein